MGFGAPAVEGGELRNGRYHSYLNKKLAAAPHSGVGLCVELRWLILGFPYRQPS